MSRPRRCIGCQARHRLPRRRVWQAMAECRRPLGWASPLVRPGQPTHGPATARDPRPGAQLPGRSPGRCLVRGRAPDLGVAAPRGASTRLRSVKKWLRSPADALGRIHPPRGPRPLDCPAGAGISMLWQAVLSGDTARCVPLAHVLPSRRAPTGVMIGRRGRAVYGIIGRAIGSCATVAPSPDVGNDRATWARGLRHHDTAPAKCPAPDTRS
jgi:hypothetical protein